VDAVELAQAARQRLASRPHHEVVVRVHQAVRVADPPVAALARVEQVEEADPVAVAAEDGRFVDASGDDVEVTVGE
jgi:hypothetical protein